MERNMHELHRKEHGFTLLELLVVIVIIGLLAGYVAPRYFAQVGKSEIQVAKAQIESLEKALDQYRLDMRRYPSADEGLQALVTKPENAPAWSGPYLKKAVPMDPWGRPYAYRTPGQKGEFELFSYGRDGRPGGTGDDADIGL
jgi:general secretion pathway protein G